MNAYIQLAPETPPYEKLFSAKRTTVLKRDGVFFSAPQVYELDDVMLICNGTIYNCKELAEEHFFDCATNNEIVVHLYLKFIRDCTGASASAEYIRYMNMIMGVLDGSFALVLYDARAGVIVAARATQPLYYEHNEASITFSTSEASSVKEFQPWSWVALDLKNPCENVPFNKFFHSDWKLDRTLIGLPVDELKERVGPRLRKLFYEAVRKRCGGDIVSALRGELATNWFEDLALINYLMTIPLIFNFDTVLKCTMREIIPAKECAHYSQAFLNRELRIW